MGARFKYKKERARLLTDASERRPYRQKRGKFIPGSEADRRGQGPTARGLIHEAIDLTRRVLVHDDVVIVVEQVIHVELEADVSTEDLPVVAQHRVPERIA